jgi:hypothetical protein
VPLFLLVSMDSKLAFRYEVYDEKYNMFWMDWGPLWRLFHHQWVVQLLLCYMVICSSLPPPMSSAIVAMLHGYLLWKSRRWYRRRLSAKYLFLSAVGFCALLDCCARFRDWNNQGLCNACKTFENLLVCVLQSFPRIE